MREGERDGGRGDIDRQTLNHWKLTFTYLPPSLLLPPPSDAVCTAKGRVSEEAQ